MSKEFEAIKELLLENNDEETFIKVLYFLKEKIEDIKDKIDGM